MDPWRPVQFAIERTDPGTEVIRVAGEFSATAGRLLVAMLDRWADHSDPSASHPNRVFVDLGSVRSFAVEGIEVLHRAERCLEEAGICLMLSGLEDRRALLPGRVDQTLDGFHIVSDLETALAT